VRKKIWVLLLISSALGTSPAYAQLSQEPQFTNPAQKENWVEWSLLQTLKDTLLPAYIPSQTEEDVQHWLGEVTKYKSEFSEAHEHILNMDHATRAHDVKTASAEVKAAADILNRIPWKPYAETDEFNDTHDNSGSPLNGSVSQDSNSNPNSNWNPSFSFPPMTGGYPPSMSGSFPPVAPQRPFTGGGPGVIPTNLPPSGRDTGTPTPTKPGNTPSKPTTPPSKPTSKPTKPNSAPSKPASTPDDTPHVINGNAGKHFSKPEDALKDWATSVWTSSKKWNVEVAGKLYKNGDNTWSYSPSYPGTRDSSNPDDALPYVLQHAGPLSSNLDIHSHGGYQGLTPLQQKSVDELSNTDKRRSARLDKSQFVLTPGGVVNQWTPNPVAHFSFAVGGGTLGSSSFIGNLNNGEAWNTPSGL